MHCAQPDDCAFDGTTWECVFCGRKCGETMTSKSEMKRIAAMKGEPYPFETKAPVVGHHSFTAYDFGETGHGQLAADIANAKVATLQAKLKLAEEAIVELVSAMKRYQMDVDDTPPGTHLAMMERAENALAELRKA